MGTKNKASGAGAAPHQNFGFWSVDMRSGTVVWDRTAAAIHGIPESDRIPLHEALGRFSAVDRARLVERALAAFHTRTQFDIRAWIDAGRLMPVRVIGGRGYSALGNAAELHGIIEALPLPQELGSNGGEALSASSSAAALLHQCRIRVANIFACSMEIEREPDVTAIVSQRAERISGAAAESLQMIDALSREYDDETLRRG